MPYSIVEKLVQKNQKGLIVEYIILRDLTPKPTDDYQLILEFTNGECGLYDCKPLLYFGVFRELQDINYFKQVAVIDGTVTWVNEQDICSDTLYLDSVMINNEIATIID